MVNGSDVEKIAASIFPGEQMPNENLEHLKNMASEGDPEGGFMNPNMKPKKGEGKRGRPPGSGKKKKEDEQQTQSTAAPIEMVLDPEMKKYMMRGVNVASLKIVKFTTVEKAALLDEEKDALAEGFALLAQKYLPKITGEYALEISVATTILLIGLRIKGECDLELERRLAMKAKMDAQNGVVQNGTETVRKASNVEVMPGMITQ